MESEVRFGDVDKWMWVLDGGKEKGWCREKEKNIYYNAAHDLLIFPVFFNRLANKHHKPSVLTITLITPLLQAECVCVTEAWACCTEAVADRVIRAACLCSAVMSFLHNEGPQGTAGEGGWLTTGVIQQELTAAREDSHTHTWRHSLNKLQTHTHTHEWS